VSNCCIHDGEGQGDGIAIIASSKATLDDNYIHSIAGNGVLVAGEGSEAVLRNNRIHNGKRAGVIIMAQGKATLENNVISSHAGFSMAVQNEGTEAVMTGNRIHSGGSQGLLVLDKAKATLANNAIIAHASVGVGVVTGTAVTMPISGVGMNTIMGNGDLSIENQVRYM
jgi:hypothetical protein